MDGYHPETVFSSIDRHGRYAYARQPDIAAWNLAQLASCLLPLIDPDREAGIAAATEALHAFPDLFKAEWLGVFRPKIGLGTGEEGDAELIHGLLDLMAAEQADFTNTFRALADGTARDAFRNTAAYDAWAADWKGRLAREDDGEPAQRQRMRAANPAVIPRNHRVEEAIRAGLGGDFGPFHALAAALARPFDDWPDHAAYRTPPTPDQEVRQTFCGT